MNRRSLITLVIALSSVLFSFAQNAVSPYSKFGYGLLRDNATAAQRQMGYTGYAMQSGRQINVMNPASYAAIDTLTFLFDMGLDLTLINSADNGTKLNQQGGGLDYITMQVPIGRYMGASLGLLPYSSVGYSFGNEIDNGLSARQGSGGLNQLYLGYAARPFKGFSVGLNFSYLFGNITNQVFAYTNTGSTSAFSQYIDVRDWHIQFGAQYGLNVAPGHRLTAGLTYSPGKDLRGHAMVTKQDITSNLNERPDTLSRIPLQKHFSLPDTWGAGIAYQMGQKLTVEADVTYQPWSKVKFTAMDGFAAPKFADRYQIGVGASIVPHYRGNYLQRMTYRIGALYNRDYMMVSANGKDNNVKEYALTCGFGFPTVAGKTIINLGFEYHHRQATPDPLLKESYFNITLGINFNEIWFLQSKIR